MGRSAAHGAQLRGGVCCAGARRRQRRTARRARATDRRPAALLRRHALSTPSPRTIRYLAC